MMAEARVIEVRHAGRLTLMQVSVNARDCGGEVPGRGEAVRLVGEFVPAGLRALTWRVARRASDRYAYGFYDLWLEPVEEGT